MIHIYELILILILDCIFKNFNYNANWILILKICNVILIKHWLIYSKFNIWLNLLKYLKIKN